MSVLYIEDDDSGEDIMLDTSDFIEKIKSLCAQQTFLYNQDDPDPIGMGDLIDEILQPILRSVIMNMKMVVSNCYQYMDKEYIKDLSQILNTNTSNSEPANAQVVILNYEEALFLDKYRNEVLDWIPLMFEVVVLPFKSNISELAVALSDY